MFFNFHTLKRMSGAACLRLHGIFRGTSTGVCIYTPRTPIRTVQCSVCACFVFLSSRSSWMCLRRGVRQQSLPHPLQCLPDFFYRSSIGLGFPSARRFTRVEFCVPTLSALRAVCLFCKKTPHFRGIGIRNLPL